MSAELAYRVNDGTHVALLWHRETDRVTVEIFDAGTGDHLSVAVRPDRALDAFHHPYAYASRRRIHVTARTPEPCDA